MGQLRFHFTESKKVVLWDKTRFSRIHRSQREKDKRRRERRKDARKRGRRGRGGEMRRRVGWRGCRKRTRWIEGFRTRDGIRGDSGDSLSDSLLSFLWAEILLGPRVPRHYSTRMCVCVGGRGGAVKCNTLSLKIRLLKSQRRQVAEFSSVHNSNAMIPYSCI